MSAYRGCCTRAMVRPATLGSTLDLGWRARQEAVPTAEIAGKGNLFGVVSPDEWEAIATRQAVAAARNGRSGPPAAGLRRT